MPCRCLEVGTPLGQALGEPPTPTVCAPPCHPQPAVLFVCLLRVSPWSLPLPPRRWATSVAGFGVHPSSGDSHSNELPQ